ncbi:MAG: HNH endonuclease [Elusimicrobiota bacterium]
MIPLPARDAVWCRDGGRCAFIGPDGRRCPETAGLEVDHIVPWAAGGSSTDTRNLRLACRQHNLLFARRCFGAAAIENAIQRRREETKQLPADPSAKPGHPTVRADSQGASRGRRTQKESE